MCSKLSGSGKMCVYVWESKRLVFSADFQMCENQIKRIKVPQNRLYITFLLYIWLIQA